MIENSLRKLESSIVEAILGTDVLNYLENSILPRQVLQKYLSHIKQLSQRYTDASTSRVTEKVKLQDMSDAYALYFTLINYRKIWHLLTQLPAWEGKQPIDILDYGCGTGTAGIAAADFWDHAMQISALDHSDMMLKSAKRLVSAHKKNVSHATWQFSREMERFKSKQFDIIFLANMINEMESGDAENLIIKLQSRLKSGGYMIILEPALVVPTQNLMALRDKVLEVSRHMVPIFPCTHSEACPMIADSPKDWCHGVIQWERPRLTRQLDDLTGFNKHRIKYSALIFQRGGTKQSGFRLVGVPVKHKFGMEMNLCSERGLENFLFPKKVCSKQKREFARLNLLDHLSITPEPVSGMKIDGKSTISINHNS